MANRPSPAAWAVGRAERAAAEIDRVLSALPADWPRVRSAAAFCGSGGWLLADVRAAAGAGRAGEAAALAACLEWMAARAGSWDLAPPDYSMGAVAHWPMSKPVKRETGKGKRKKAGKNLF
jgi:hypothetical protein